MGGAQENTLITCKLLAQRGHDVTLITGPAIGPEGELFEQASKEQYKIITIEEMIRAINPVKDWIAYRKIRKLLKEIQPDIVHTHSAKAGILGRYAGDKLKKGRIPKVVHTIHGLAFHRYQGNWLNRFYIAIEKRAAKRTDFFISVADAMTAQALAAGIGEPEKFVTAYSAVDEDAFLRNIPLQETTDLRVNYGISRDAVVLVTVARLFELKGHDYIIESAKELSKRFDNAVWLFVGDGNLSEFYKKQVTELGLARCIKFTGLLPPSKIPLVLQSSDILVHCSLREGLARAIPQGMLCGLPAVAFDLDGTREVVNENTGRLIEPQNVEQLINACAELIGNMPLTCRLGDNAKGSVKDKFAPQTMVDKIEEVYKKLLEDS